MRNFLLQITFALMLTSCLQQVAGVGDSKEGGSGSGFTGCTSITQMSETSFKINFIFPSTASEVYIYRDGSQVFSTVERTTTSYTDEGLDEGITAVYTCYAKIDDKVVRGGTQKRGETDVLNPPTFAGITNAIAQSPTSVKLYWGSHTAGARPKYFQIFTSMVTTDGLFDTVRTTVDGAYKSVVLNDLADEVPYYFAVRACAKGDICDSNTASETLTMADKGKPTTTGPSAANIVDGSVVLTVPWEEAHGGLKRRRVYRKVQGGSYSLQMVKTIASSDIGNPITEITDTNVSEATTYFYYVTDEDPSGNQTTQAESNELMVEVADLTRPVFAGLTNGELKSGSEDNAVTLSFTAGPTEADNALTGMNRYLLFATESDPPAEPADACAAAEEKIISILSANSYTNGQSYSFDVEDLTPRKKYNFCLKGEDSVGNKSETTASESLVIRDIVPPEFFGLQTLSYDSAAQEFTLGWSASESSDIKSYKIWVWKNSNTKTVNPTATVLHTDSPSSAVIGKGTFSFNDGDIVYFHVNACDNASPTFNTDDNCTDLSNATVRSMQLEDLTPPTFVGTGLSMSMVDLFASDTADVRALISWTEPTNLASDPDDPESGFGGFRVYDVDQTLGTVELLKDCACPNLECVSGEDHSKQCLVEDLDANRDYNFFVSAYDDSQNLYKSGHIAAANVANLTPRVAGTTRDDKKPTFAANFLSNVNLGTNNLELSWSAAQDNQETSKSGNQLHYRVYFKSTTDIADSNAPEDDGTLLYSGTSLTHNDSLTDTDKWNPGSTYYFVVCAVDQYGQDNYSDASIRAKHEVCVGGYSKTLQDTVDPEVTNLAIADAANSNGWTLTGEVSDNFTATTSLTLQVYRKFSDDINAQATDADEFLSGATSLGQAGSFTIFSDPTNPTDTSSPQLQYHFVHYLVQARDAQGNAGEAHYTRAFRTPEIGSFTPDWENGFDEDTVISYTLPSPSNAPGVSTNATLRFDLDYSSQTITAYLADLTTVVGTIDGCMNLANSSGDNDLSCQLTPSTNYNTNNATLALYYADGEKIQIFATDGVASSSPGKDIYVRINPVNDPPTISMPDTNWTTKHSSAGTFDLSEYFQDVDGDTLSIKTFSGTGAGTYHSTNSPTTSVQIADGPDSGLPYWGSTIETYSLVITDGVLDSDPITITNYRLRDLQWLNRFGDNNVANLANYCQESQLAQAIHFGRPWEVDACDGATAFDASVRFSDGFCEGDCNANISGALEFNHSFILQDNYTGTVTMQTGSSLNMNGNHLIVAGPETGPHAIFDGTNGSLIQFDSFYDNPYDEIGQIQIPGGTFKAPARILYKPVSRSATVAEFKPIQLGGPGLASDFEHNNGIIEFDFSESTGSGFETRAIFNVSNLHLYTLKLTDVDTNNGNETILLNVQQNLYLHGNLDFKDLKVVAEGDPIFKMKSQQNPANAVIELYGDYLPSPLKTTDHEYTTKRNYVNLVYLKGDADQKFGCANNHKEEVKFINQKTSGSFSYDSNLGTSDTCHWYGLEWDENATLNLPPNLHIHNNMTVTDASINAASTNLYLRPIVNTTNGSDDTYYYFPADANNFIVDKLQFLGTDIVISGDGNRSIFANGKVKVNTELSYKSGTQLLRLPQLDSATLSVDLLGDFKHYGITDTSTGTDQFLDVNLIGTGDQTLTTDMGAPYFENTRHLSNLTINKPSGNVILAAGDIQIATNLSILSNTTIKHNGNNLTGNIDINNGVALSFDDVDCSPTCNSTGLGDVTLGADFAGTIVFPDSTTSTFTDSLEVSGSGTINFGSGSTLNLVGITTTSDYSGALNIQDSSTVTSSDAIKLLGSGSFNLGAGSSLTTSKGFELSTGYTGTMTIGNNASLLAPDNTSFQNKISFYDGTVNAGSGVTIESHDTQTVSVAGTAAVTIGDDFNLVITGSGNAARLTTSSNGSLTIGDNANLDIQYYISILGDSVVSIASNATLQANAIYAGSLSGRMSIGSSSTVHIEEYIQCLTFCQLDLSQVQTLTFASKTIFPNSTAPGYIKVDGTASVEMPAGTTTFYLHDLQDSEAVYTPFQLVGAGVTADHNNGTVVYDFGYTNAALTTDTSNSTYEVTLQMAHESGGNYYPYTYYNLSFKDLDGNNTHENILITNPSATDNVVIENNLSFEDFEVQGGETNRTIGFNSAGGELISTNFIASPSDLGAGLNNGDTFNITLNSSGNQTISAENMDASTTLKIAKPSGTLAFETTTTTINIPKLQTEQDFAGAITFPANKTINIAGDVTLYGAGSLTFGDNSTLNLNSFIKLINSINVTVGGGSTIKTTILEARGSSQFTTGPGSTIHIRDYIKGQDSGIIDFSTADSLTLASPTIYPSDSSSAYILLKNTSVLDLPSTTTTFYFHDLQDGSAELTPFHLKSSTVNIDHNNGTVVFDFGYDNLLVTDDIKINLAPETNTGSEDYNAPTYYNLTFKDQAGSNDGEVITLVNDTIIPVEGNLSFSQFDIQGSEDSSTRYIHFANKKDDDTTDAAYFEVHGNYYAPNYSFTHSSGSLGNTHSFPRVSFVGTGAQTFNCPAGFNNSRFIINKASGSLTFDENFFSGTNTSCQIYAIEHITGAFTPPASLTVNRIEDWDNTEVTEPTNFAVTIKSFGDHGGYTAPAITLESDDLTLYKPNGSSDFVLNGSATVNNDLLFLSEDTSQELGISLTSPDTNRFSITLLGDLLDENATASTYPARDIAITLSGSNNQTINGQYNTGAKANQIARHITINKSGGTVSLASDIDMHRASDFTSSFTMTAGSLDFNGFEIYTNAYSDAGITIDTTTAGSCLVDNSGDTAICNR